MFCHCRFHHCRCRTAQLCRAMRCRCVRPCPMYGRRQFRWTAIRRRRTVVWETGRLWVPTVCRAVVVAGRNRSRMWVRTSLWDGRYVDGRRRCCSVEIGLWDGRLSRHGHRKHVQPAWHPFRPPNSPKLFGISVKSWHRCIATRKMSWTLLSGVSFTPRPGSVSRATRIFHDPPVLHSRSILVVFSARAWRHTVLAFFMRYVELDTLTRWLLVNLIDLYIFYSKVGFLICLHFRVSFGVQWNIQRLETKLVRPKMI